MVKLWGILATFLADFHFAASGCLELIAQCLEIIVMLWVAGGKCVYTFVCDRNRGRHSDLTYLTLPTVPYLKLC